MSDTLADGRARMRAAWRFAAIIRSHQGAHRRYGREVLAVRIHEQEAARWGLRGMTAIIGIPVEPRGDLPLGLCQMQLDDGTGWEIDLTVWFTED